MDETSVSPRKRRFTGRAGRSRPPGGGFDVLAEVLLSSPPSPAAATEPTTDPAPAPLLADTRDFYVVDAAGLDPRIRRPSALAAAAHLAARRARAAVFVFHDSRVDAHVFGERACGRLGPQHGASDVGGTVAELVGECEQVGVVLLDGPVGPAGDVVRSAARVVLVATPDSESLVEAYREAKRWHAVGARGLAALFVGDGSASDGVGPLYRRLHRAARSFLGEELELLGRVGGGRPREAPHAWFRIFSEASAADVWPRLLAPPGADAACGPPSGAGELGADDVQAAPEEEAGPAALPGPRRPPAGAWAAGGPPAGPPPEELPVVESARVPAPAVLSLWRPETVDDVRGAVEVQLPALLGERFRTAFRVDVEEPGAPSLVAVRDDGGMVAVLIAENGTPVDTRAAVRWLAVHRSLLAGICGSVRLAAEVSPSAVVLAPLDVPHRGDGVRRFLPVRCGGRRGVVLLP